MAEGGPDVIVPAVPPLSRLDRVEVAHTDYGSLTRDDLVAAVAALDCPAVRRPVIKLGDTTWAGNPTGEPAVGWVENLALADEGHTLVGDMAGMPGWLGDVAATSVAGYRVEGTYEHRCQIGHIHPFVITAVALPGGGGTLSSLQDVAHLYGVTTETEQVAAHLPGRHNQKTHGRRYNVPGDPSSGLRRSEDGDTQPAPDPNPEPEPELPPDVSVTETRGRLHVQSPYDKAFIAGLKNMGGRWLPKSRTWSVPADRETDLRALIADTFNAPAESADTLPQQVTVRTRANGKIEVGAPFNDAFRREAKELGGAWDPSAKKWVFPPHREGQVRAAAQRHYGQQWQDAQRAAQEAQQQARRANRQARGQQAMTPRQRNLVLKLLNRHGRDDMFWHDFFDGAGGPAGQYQPGGPSRAQIEEWLSGATSTDASSLIDDLIAWGRGY